jgi:hypothetical protein
VTVEWALSRDWFHSASRLDGGDARRLLAFQKKLYDDPDCVGRGLHFEHLRGVHDRRIQSLRVDGAVRAIVWHDGDLGVLLYVDQHEPAYRWAEAARVGVSTLSDCVAVAVAVAPLGGDGDEASGVAGPCGDGDPDGEDCLFARVGTAELHDAGVPEILVPLVRGIREDRDLDELTPALRPELGDRLLALCLGEYGAAAVPRPAEPAAAASPPPDASPGKPGLPPGSCRALPLRAVDPDDFQRLLENPTEWWVAFADPVQRRIAEATFSGAVLVTGGAGTGKTIVAMHRARHLARKGKRVLITSYNVALCEAIRRDIALLCTEPELERITVRNIDDEALHISPDDQMALGVDKGELFALRIRRATELLSTKAAHRPYDAVIVDETQDLDVPRLALVRALAGKGRDSLTLLGDMNQRIYGEPLDLEDLHISVEGRTFTLATGYRTTREIAELGQGILAGRDGVAGDIPGTVETPATGVPGPRPLLVQYPSLEEEAVAVALDILAGLQSGVPAERMAVFARRRERLRGIELALNALGVPCMDLDLGREAPRVGVRLMTMHLARGLEFRVVYVIGASDAELPDPAPLEKAANEAERRSVLGIERALLHVSATRATHELHVSWVGRPTPYLDGCSELADSRSGLAVEQYLGVELDTATLATDPAGFRIAGQDYVAGGRQIARVLCAHLEEHAAARA